MQESKCPCQSGKLMKDCCAPVIAGERKASTPEELMRARYSAYATAAIDFIIDSTHPDQRESNDRDAIKEWAEKSEWMGLEIKAVSKGGPGDQDGTVEFVAKYSDRGMQMDHHELAEFRRAADGSWLFYDGKLVQPAPFKREAPKTGRNDPCPCGSGKKFKKCCGA